MRFVFLFLFLHLGLFADWMTDQIEEDLLPHRGKVWSREELAQELRSQRGIANGLILVEISGGRVHIEALSDACASRLSAVSSFLNHLSQNHALPDTAFLLSLHDSVESEGVFAKQLGEIPVFTFAKRKGALSILIPDFEALLPMEGLIADCSRFSKLNPWKKKHSLVFWRGASTGAMLSLENYLQVPRVQLVLLSQQYKAWLDASFTFICQADESVEKVLKQYTKPHQSMQSHFAYKYLIDVDGNSCTYSRCRWILLSNSVLLKQASSNIQWYYKALVPYQHFIPVKQDLSDLPEVYAWLKSHDKEAKRVAKEGKKLARDLFSSSSIDLYVKQLISAYAQLGIDKEVEVGLP
ncbi:MAG: protein O-glucosyltransferase 2 [Chlamydiota bacterium]|jgi:hypothetical protein